MIEQSVKNKGKEIWTSSRNTLYILILGLMFAIIVTGDRKIFNWGVSRIILALPQTCAIITYYIIDWIDSRFPTNIDKNITIDNILKWFLCIIAMGIMVAFIIYEKYLYALIFNIIYNFIAPEQRDKEIYGQQENAAKQKQDFEKHYKARNTRRVKQNVFIIGIVISIFTLILIISSFFNILGLKVLLEKNIKITNQDSCSIRMISESILLFVLCVSSLNLKYKRHKFVLIPLYNEQQKVKEEVIK